MRKCIFVRVSVCVCVCVCVCVIKESKRVCPCQTCHTDALTLFSVLTYTHAKIVIDSACISVYVLVKCVCVCVCVCVRDNVSYM